MKSVKKPLFAENPLDKMDHVRASLQAYTSADILSKNDNQFLLFYEDDICFSPSSKTVFFSGETLQHIAHDHEKMVFLGAMEEQNYFAVSVKSSFDINFETTDLRSFTSSQLLPDNHLGMIAQAKSLLQWHETHGFCSNCGTKTIISHGGWRRDCPNCKKQHFPRVDPVVIMLVTHGEKCLIGTGHNFGEIFSCLAGFVEPGETIEDAARRELFEEAGILGGEVTYMTSQPWPFPYTLMVGVHVAAESTEIKIDVNELKDAKWVSKSDIVAVLQGATDRGFLLSKPYAIARTLFEIWVAETIANSINNGLIV